jgi:hypothetical protein
MDFATSGSSAVIARIASTFAAHVHAHLDATHDVLLRVNDETDATRGV